MADEKASAGAGVGPIAEPATEPQQPAPAAQQEPASSSSGLAAPMPTQLSEQADGFTDGVGPQERRERKGARPSETPTSEISGRPVVKARPASPPMIVPTAEGSGAVVLSTPASFSKDEMAIGGLYVIDESTLWKLSSQRRMCGSFEATETCTTETQIQDTEQGINCGWDYEDPSATEAIEAYDARTGENFDSEEVRNGRAREVRQLD